MHNLARTHTVTTQSEFKLHAPTNSPKVTYGYLPLKDRTENKPLHNGHFIEVPSPMHYLTSGPELVPEKVYYTI